MYKHINYIEKYKEIKYNTVYENKFLGKGEMKND
jgi:hypothetical protein